MNFLTYLQVPNSLIPILIFIIFNFKAKYLHYNMIQVIFLMTSFHF